MSSRASPLTRRLHKKLGEKFLYQVSLEEAGAIKRAFVEALKEEVESRFGPLVGAGVTAPLSAKPLVIAGLGSFKTRTRPGRKYLKPGGKKFVDAPVTKPPARRLVFSSKWEPLP